MKTLLIRAGEGLVFGVETGAIYLMLRFSLSDTEAAALTVALVVVCLIAVIFFVEGGAER